MRERMTGRPCRPHRAGTGRASAGMGPQPAASRCGNSMNVISRIGCSRGKRQSPDLCANRAALRSKRPSATGLCPATWHRCLLATRQDDGPPRAALKSGRRAVQTAKNNLAGGGYTGENPIAVVGYAYLGLGIVTQFCGIAPYGPRDRDHRLTDHAGCPALHRFRGSTFSAETGDRHDPTLKIHNGVRAPGRNCGRHRDTKQCAHLPWQIHKFPLRGPHRLCVLPRAPSGFAPSMRAGDMRAGDMRAGDMAGIRAIIRTPMSARS
jgi:hypothetical protein